ncbi:MAG: SEC-C metal-binding domain-containing protein [Thermodesulfovibrionales bacterium]
MGLWEKVLSLFAAREEEAAGRLPGRNEPCRCGSGKKYKKCHLDEDMRKQKQKYSASCGTG